MAWYDILLGRRPSDEEALSKAKGKAVPKPTSWELDPHDYASHYNDEQSGGYHPGTMGLSFEQLRMMSRVPLISAVIQTRVNQVSEFAIPQATPYSLGFKLRMREHTKEPSKAGQKRIQELTRWLQTCGDPRLQVESSFESFLRRIIRDSLVFDQAAFEIVRTRGGGIAGMIPVDASTIRRAKMSEADIKSGRRPVGTSQFVQLLNSKVVARFGPDDLVLGIRRPRTWIKANGYGYPELEELVRVITNLLNAESYNASNFTHGMHVAGILAIKSKMNPQLFRAFRREFYSMLSGAHNAHKTPLIQLDPENKEELQQINMTSTNREMEYTNWQSWLLRTVCSVYQISPTSLGGQWQFGNEGQNNSLATGGPTERITASRELGLRPLLRAVQGWLNRGVIYEMAPDFELEFVGFDAKTEEQKLDMDIKSVKHFRTINEVRAMWDMEKLDSDVGDMVLDPTYINTAWQMSMQEEEGGEEEDPTGGGEFDYASLFGDMGGGAEEEDLAEEAPAEEAPTEAFARSRRRAVSVEVE